MSIGGSILVLGLALVAVVFTALLLTSAANGLREELWPGSRRAPPSPRTIALALFGAVLPVLLIAVLTAFLAAWLLGMLM